MLWFLGFVGGVSKRPNMKDFALFGWWLANKNKYHVSLFTTVLYCTTKYKILYKAAADAGWLYLLSIMWYIIL